MPAVIKSDIQRAHWRSAYYLSWFDEAVVFSRDVNMPAITYPVSTLVYAGTGVGVPGDVLRDMELRITRAGAEVGRLRVRGPATASTIPVGEFSRGYLDLQNGDRIEVLRSWRIRERLPAADATFNPDQQAYTDQHADPAPIACSGGPYVNYRDYASAVVFDGTLSRTIDVDSTAGVTHSWTFPAGAVPLTSTGAAPTVDLTDCALGTHWATHVVTDASNGKSTTQYVPIRLHGFTSSTPTDVLEFSLDASSDDAGWRMSATVRDALDVTTLPDRALVVLWAVEHYDTTRASFGAPAAGRGHIKFVGYLDRDTVQRDPERHTLTFEAISAGEVLQRLPGFGTALEHNFTPASWFEVRRLDTNQAILYRLRELTTIERSVDIELPAEPLLYPAFYVQQATPYQQVLELADGIDCQLITTRRGLLRVVRSVALRTPTDRNAAVVVLTLNEDDVLAIRSERAHRHTYYQVEGRALMSTNDEASAAPLFCRAPGLAPGDGASETVIERLIASPAATTIPAIAQGDLNLRVGYRYARLNRLRDGRPVRRFTATLRGAYDVFDPAYPDEWVRLQNIALRRGGIGATPLRCTVEAVGVTGSARGVEVALTLLEETIGPPAATYTYPSSPAAQVDTTPPSLLPPDTTPPLAAPVTPVRRIPQRLWAVSWHNPPRIARAYTINADTAVINWEEVTPHPVTGEGLWGFHDPYQPRRKYIITTTGLWRTENLFAASPVFTLVADNVTMFGGTSAQGGSWGMMSPNRQGWIWIQNSSQTAAYSSDYGATWARVRCVPGITGLDLAASGPPENTAQKIALSPWNTASSGVLYSVVATGSGVRRGAISRDWGVTWQWAMPANVTGFDPAYSHIPRLRQNGAPNVNDASQEIWYAIQTGTNLGALRRSVDAGVTFTNVRTTLGGSEWFGIRGFTIDSYPYDSRVMAVTAGQFTHPAWVGTSRDGFVTVQNKIDVPTGGIINQALNVSCYAYNPDVVIAFIRARYEPPNWSNLGALFLTLNSGVNWTNSWPTFFPDRRVAYAAFDMEI